MKISHLFAALFLVSTVAMAAPEVSPKLVNLNVKTVGKVGTILKETHQHPYSNFLIAIPVEVETGSVCVDFVGQEDVKSTSPKATVALQAKGSVNPLTEACVEIYPMPTKTEFTFNFSVVTGGFVPAKPVQQTVVEIPGAGDYLVTLDMGRDTVTLRSVK